MISAKQIKAARAMLDWSQETLARQSGLSTGTIINLEKGFLSQRSCGEIEKTLQRLGFEIIGETGVNLRAPTSRTYEGTGSSEYFFADLLATIRKTGCSISAVFRSQDAFLGALGLKSGIRFNQLEELSKLTTTKCLLIGVQNISTTHTAVEFRSTPQYPMGPLGLIIYGDKAAVIYAFHSEWTYFVIRSVDVALDHQKEFHAFWNSAIPLAKT